MITSEPIVNVRVSLRIGYNYVQGKSVFSFCYDVKGFISDYLIMDQDGMIWVQSPASFDKSVNL
jgi:hypothetical protein